MKHYDYYDIRMMLKEQIFTKYSDANMSFDFNFFADINFVPFINILSFLYFRPATQSKRLGQ